MIAEQDLLSGPHQDMSLKLARLRKENELLRQQRDLLKSDGLLRSGDTAMTFAFIDAQKVGMSLARLCSCADVSIRGYYAWKPRAPSRRQQDDMTTLAQIRNQFALSSNLW